MCEPIPYDAMDVLPNRLAKVAFHPVEVSTILGDTDGEYEFQMDSFNWVAAFLHDEFGMEDEAIVDWFREPAPGLGDRPPLLAWAAENGFWKVFEYAQFVKHQADEECQPDDPSQEKKIFRSHQVGNYLLEMVREGFKVAGVEVGPEITDTTDMGQAVHNPDSGNPVLLTWQRMSDDAYETYKIILNYGADKDEARYSITRCLAEEEPFIIQSGIIKEGFEEMDSSLDGRPPSAGELASFAIPLAKEIQDRSFIPFET
jgi:hypothetical protein